MADPIKHDYLIARAIEEKELAELATTKAAKVAHLQMAAEYEERAGDLAARLLSDSDDTGD